MANRNIYKDIRHKTSMTEKIICECGMLVKSISKKQLESNMVSHKKGNKHKELMKTKKELANNKRKEEGK